MLMIPQTLFREMDKHVHASLRRTEICGILAGRSNVAVAIYPITNALDSATRFDMEPMELLAALMDMENKAWEIQAIYHTHPNGPDHPSETDIQEASLPGVLHVLWYYLDRSWYYRTYRIDALKYTEASFGVFG